MSEKIQLSIRDFPLFCEVIRSTAKIVDSAKLSIDENGLSIYGARARTARCEILSNSVFSEKPVQVCVLDLKLLDRVLTTVKDVHQDDYTDFKLIVELPFLKFQSKKFKTKLSTCNEDIIGKWVSKKVETQLNPVFEFTTTSDMIKNINGHSYIFKDGDKLRVYLETKDDMENNTLFASIGNRESDLNNEMTLKFGLVTFGSLNDKELTLDLERVNLLNSVQSNDIKVSLMDRNVLVCNSKVIGKNDSYYSVTVYNTLLKS